MKSIIQSKKNIIGIKNVKFLLILLHTHSPPTFKLGFQSSPIFTKGVNNACQLITILKLKNLSIYSFQNMPSLLGLRSFAIYENTHSMTSLSYIPNR